MKAKLIVLSIGILLVNASWISPAPSAKQECVTGVTATSNAPESGYTFFRAHRQTRFGVTSTWGFSTCSNVAVFEVQRNVFFPVEDWAWETVSMTPCTGNRSYKFTDIPVDAGYISYRIVAKMTDGSEVVSDTETIHIISH